MSTGMTPTRIVLFILYAVALAMGVVAIVLPYLGQTVDISLIGIALFCLGIAGLNQVQSKN